MYRLFLITGILLAALFPLACQKIYTLGPLTAVAPTPTSSPTLTSTPGSCGSGGVVTTLAGSGSSGSANGPATTASFNFPTGIAVDSSGNVYVGDTDNALIRKITPAGVVSTLAGGGVCCATNGTGTAASFNRPYGVAVDQGGNVYVADDGNNLIRKITPGGVVSTLAGQAGVSGAMNGPASIATFFEPFGVALDPSGNVYVSDLGNSLIRVITPAGVVSTLAGSVSYGFANGTGTAATFWWPEGIAVDSGGNVFVADEMNRVIRKITPGGVVTTLAGQVGVMGSANGTGTAATFLTPTGVAVDSLDNVYVTDYGNSLIRKITPGGVVSTLAGQTGITGAMNGPVTSALFYAPAGAAVDSCMHVYVADTWNDLIREIHQ